VLRDQDGGSAGRDKPKLVLQIVWTIAGLLVVFVTMLYLLE
jgi:hypothetical protein